MRTQENEERGRENLYCLREYLNCHKQTVDRSINVHKGTTSECSEGNDEHVIRNWRKRTFVISSESLIELCPQLHGKHNS